MSQIDGATWAKVKGEIEENGGSVSASHPSVYQAPSGEAASDVPGLLAWRKHVDQNNELYKDAAIEQFEREQSSAQAAMDFEASQAQLNRDFQERMSNTAYQRARADLEAAGFNPILAFSQGGASTPSGSSASGFKASASRAEVDTETYRAVLDALTDVVSSALKAVGSALNIG